jgi:hypothetical protein
MLRALVPVLVSACVVSGCPQKSARQPDTPPEEPTQSNVRSSSQRQRRAAPCQCVLESHTANKSVTATGKHPSLPHSDQGPQTPSAGYLRTVLGRWHKLGTKPISGTSRGD